MSLRHDQLHPRQPFAYASLIGVTSLSLVLGLASCGSSQPYRFVGQPIFDVDGTVDSNISNGEIEGAAKIMCRGKNVYVWGHAETDDGTKNYAGASVSYPKICADSNIRAAEWKVAQSSIQKRLIEKLNFENQT